MAPTLTLTMTLAVGSFLVLMALSLLLIHPDLSKFGNNFGNQQNQHVKSALYVVAFAVILPLALIFAPRIADGIAAGPNGPALPGISRLLVVTLGAAILGVKLSGQLPWGDGLGVLLFTTSLWLVLAAAALVRAIRTRPWLLLLRAANVPGTTVTAGLVMLGVLLSVSPHSSAYLLPLAVGALVSAALLVLYMRWRAPAFSGRLGGVVDGAIVILVLLAVPDTVIFTTSSAIPNPFFPPGVIQFHHNFLLGPTNQLLGGGALLVNDPVSQYGVGSIYFLAAWFHLVPIGYGTYGALDGILTALFYATAFGVLRLARVSRSLATSALAVAVVALIYNMHFPVGALPQEGPLRFGLPMALILLAVSGMRWPRHDRAARLAGYGVLAVSSVWAFEAFAYTIATFAAILAARVWLRPVGQRVQSCAREVAFAVGACVCAHLALAAATLIATGQLPAWGRYLAIVRSFLGGSAGEIVYGFSRWSPGLAVGALYLASGLAIVLLMRRQPHVFSRNPTALVAITGATAYGIALFSYADNRSATYVLCYVALPAFVTAAIWLSFILGRGGDSPRRVRLAALSAGLTVSILLLAAAWPAAGGRFSRSALAHFYPGGGLRAALQRLWDPPPIDPRAPEGQNLLTRYMPGERHVVALLAGSVDLGTEILIRSRRSNTLPFGDPKADAFVPGVSLPILRRSVMQLRSGTRLLIDDVSAAGLGASGSRSRADSPTLPKEFAGSDPTGALLHQVLGEIRARFRVRVIRQTNSGLAIAKLTGRR